MGQFDFHKTSSNSLSLSNSDLPILEKMSTAYKTWHGFLISFPRLSRYTLGGKIDTLFVEMIELVLFAGYAHKEQKLIFIQKASTKLDSLKFFLKIAWEVKALDHKKYAALAVPLVEIGKMLGGWIRQLSH